MLRPFLLAAAVAVGAPALAEGTDASGLRVAPPEIARPAAVRSAARVEVLIGIRPQAGRPKVYFAPGTGAGAAVTVVRGGRAGGLAASGAGDGVALVRSRPGNCGRGEELENAGLIF